MERRISHLLRTLFLIAAMTFTFCHRAHIARHGAVPTLGPIIAVVLSVVVLKECMTWKVLSLILGFVGVYGHFAPGGSIDQGILLALVQVYFCFLFDRHATGCAR
jgi:drug/metabolite transporter (DMT)-like permease